MITEEELDKILKDNLDLARANRKRNPAGAIIPLSPEKMERLRKELGITVEEREADFQSWVLELAHLRGWLIAHFRPARIVKDGKVSYRTAVSGDGAGFPDLVLCRGDRIIFAELKPFKGRLSEEQDKWLRALTETKVELHIWRPADRSEIEELLL